MFTALTVVAYPLLCLLAMEISPEGGSTALALSFGLAIAYLLAVGPAGGVLLVALTVFDAAVLRGIGFAPGVILVALVQVGVMLAVVAVLEARFARHGPVRTQTVIIDFIVLGAAVAPLLATVTEVGLSTMLALPTVDDPGQWTMVVARGLGVLTVTPGVRMLIMRVRVDLDRRTLSVMGLALVLTAVVTLGRLSTGGIESLIGSYGTVAPMMVLALLAGTVAYSLGLLTVTLVIMSGAAMLSGGGGYTLPLGDHLVWWAVAAIGYMLAVEADRRRAYTREYEAIFDHARTPTVEVLATLGTIVRGNAALEELTGWSTDELAGRPLAELLVESAGDAQRCEALLAGERLEVSCDLHLRCADTSLRWVRFQAVRVPTDGPQSDNIIAQFTDLTVEREREQALRRSNEALEQFGRRVAHDLKQPLAAISGYAATLAQHGDKLAPELRATMQDRLDKAARRAIAQLDEVFANAGVSGGARSLVDLESSVAGIRELLRIDLEEAVAVLTTDFAVPRVHADPVMLRQVLLNLVTNSLKYRRPGAAPTIRLASKARAGGVEIVVTDNGTGIPAEALDAVFESGTRLAPDAAAGRGVGLHDSRKLVEADGGWLRAEPWPQGARLVMWLPDALPPGDEAPPVRVLIVDDDRDQRNVIRTSLDLEAQVDVVGEAATIEDAVAATGALRPDVVLLDRWLPDGDALDAIDRFAEAHTDVRVIVLTSDTTPGLAQRARGEGVLRTMHKAVTTEEIVSELVGAG